MALLFYFFNAVKVDEGELGGIFIDGQDALDIYLGFAVKDGRIDLSVGEAGVAAGADLHILATHLEVLAH